MTAASAGSTVTVLLADGVSVPGDVIAAVRGRDVRLVFRLANGIVWTIDGRSVTSDTISDIDFGVTINSHAVPDALTRQTAAGRDYFQISLNHDGAFGFTAVMTLPAMCIRDRTIKYLCLCVILRLRPENTRRESSTRTCEENRIMKELELKSVSYTHLDVYKRQP